MKTLFIAGIALIIASPATGVVVDRIAISAGNKVITESEVELRLRLTAFQNGQRAQMSLEARKQAAERLLDQKILEREMDVGHYPRLNAEGRKQLMQDYAEQYFQAEQAALERALAAYGLTRQDLEDDLARQSDLLTFLSLRFRPAVQVSEQDVKTQFDKTSGEIPLSEMRAEIERKISNERADKDLEAWLREQRKRTRIEYLDKDLMP